MAPTTPPATIADPPKPGQIIEHQGKKYTTIREGRAYILVPPNAQTLVGPKKQGKAADDGSEIQGVFYNPIQQFNRDLSVLAIKAFGEDSCQRKRWRYEEQKVKEERKKENKRRRDGEERKQKSEVGKGVDGGDGEVKNGERRGDEQIEAHSQGTEEQPAKVTGVEGEGVAVPAAQLANGKRKRDEADEGEETSEDQPTKIRRVSEDEDDAQLQAHVEKAANGVNTRIANDTSKSGEGSSGAVKPSDARAEQQPTWRPRFRILDALSATGLRALRYASEIPYATAVVANDRERNATEAIKVNIEHNKLSSMITATTGDALGHMYGVAFPPPNSHGPRHISGKYDVIDLDPYGTAAPFIDAALQALEDGGLLCVTCTDSGVFASCGYSEKTFALYGGMPVKGLHSHEGGLRLILHSVATTASKYGSAIEPLLSLSIDFYARLFIRVRKSPADVKFLAGKTMLVYGCDHGCGAWTTQPIGGHQRYKNNDQNFKYTIAQAPTADHTCAYCGSKQHLAGPMWAGPMHNPVFIERILADLKDTDNDVYQTKARIEGMLDTALHELVVNPGALDFRSIKPTSKDGKKDIIPKTPPEAIDHHPFFFIPSALCKVVKAQAPSEVLFKGALRHAGYIATRSHCKPGSIKTNAPWSVVWEIIREWVRQKAPIKEGAVQENQPGWKILQAMRKVEEPQDESAAGGAEEGGVAVNGTDGQISTGNENGVSKPPTPDIVIEAQGAVTPPHRPSTPADLKRLEVVFDETLGRDSHGKRLVRYQENPRENWGPMRKAKGSKGAQSRNPQ